MHSTTKALMAALAVLAAGPALACFTVYDRNNQVLYNAQVPPVDMSRPLAETLPQKFPGGHMVFDQNVNCPIVQAAGQMRASPSAPGRSPLLTDAATARSLGLKHTSSPRGWPWCRTVPRTCGRAWCWPSPGCRRDRTRG